MQGANREVREIPAERKSLSELGKRFRAEGGEEKSSPEVASIDRRPGEEGRQMACMKEG